MTPLMMKPVSERRWGTHLVVQLLLGVEGLQVKEVLFK